MDILDVTMYKRSKANDLNNYVLEKAKAYFRTVEGIKVIDKHESLVLAFTDANILGRFKKLAKHTLLSNCDTSNQRNKALIEGNMAYFQPTLSEEIFPQATFVEFGYVENPLWTEFEKISVVKRIEKAAFELCQIPKAIVEQMPYTLKAVPADPESETQKKKEKEEEKDNQITRKKKKGK